MLAVLADDAGVMVSVCRNKSSEAGECLLYRYVIPGVHHRHVAPFVAPHPHHSASLALDCFYVESDEEVGLLLGLQFSDGLVAVDIGG